MSETKAALLEKADLTLYVDSHWASPFVFSAYVALTEKGLPFKTHDVSLSDKQQSRPEFAGPSLTARVPALVHDSYWLSESSAIVEYVAETFSSAVGFPRLFPLDLRQRGRCRQVMAWLRSDLGALREERSSETMFYPERRPRPDFTPAGARAVEKLVRVASALLPAGQSTIADSWCIADSELAFMLGRLVLNGDPLPDGLRDYFQTQWARPSVQRFVEQSRPAYR